MKQSIYFGPGHIYYHGIYFLSLLFMVHSFACCFFYTWRHSKCSPLYNFFCWNSLGFTSFFDDADLLLLEIPFLYVPIDLQSMCPHAALYSLAMWFYCGKYVSLSLMLSRWSVFKLFGVSSIFVTIHVMLFTSHECLINLRLACHAQNITYSKYSTRCMCYLSDVPVTV